MSQTILLPFLHNRKETFSTALRDMCSHFRENYLCLVSPRGKMFYTCGISLRGCRQHFWNVWLLWLPGKKSPVMGMGQIGHGDPLRNNRISSPCLGVRQGNFNDMVENECWSLGANCSDAELTKFCAHSFLFLWDTF